MADLDSSGKRITFTWSKAERKICRRRRDILTSQWAEKNRTLSTKESDREGPWRNTVTPYLVGIMDAADFPSVRQMVICKPPQTGGSEAVNNIAGKRVDIDPGNILYVYPNEKDAKKNIKRRVLNMIKSSPRLSSYLTGYKDDESTALINLSHMMIRAGWAGSPQSLASTPERCVIFEETDKYVENRKETDSIKLGKHRTRTFRGRELVILVSSPTTEAGPIWQALITDTEVIFEYVTVCPHCFAHQVMLFGDKETPSGIKWPADVRDPNLIESKELAWYQCGQCKGKWTDYHRDLAVSRGYWREKRDAGAGLELFDFLRKHRPKKIGFQYPAWISTFVTLSQCAAAFLRGLSSKTALKDFLNGYAAEPWTEYTKERDEKRIIALCDHRPPGLVPGNGLVAGLFAGVDTHGPGQNAGFYFIIRAYGWSFRWDEEGNLLVMPPEKWLIRRGFVRTFEALEHVLITDRYYDPHGNHYPVLKVVQDAMGHRTREVYDFSRKYRGWLHPFQGMQKQTRPWKFSTIDTYPGTNQAIPGGVKLLQGNVTMYKTGLASDLEVAPGDPGCRWMHASVETLLAAGHKSPSLGIDDEFCRHLTSEYVDDSGFFVCPEGKPNHYWDCEVYADIAADLYGVAAMYPPKTAVEEQTGDEYITSKSKYVSG